MRILLFGGNGHIGWELARVLPSLGLVTVMDHPDVDFSHLETLRTIIRLHKPDLIVNAAAYTSVDLAESEPEQAMAVNGIAPGILAEEAEYLGAGFVHFSTDYVFDGMKEVPYTEEDAPNPVSVYGHTKFKGDQAVEAVGGGFLILRTCWIYGTRGNNFVRTILQTAKEGKELRVVDDQIGSPTWCRSIAEATSQILSIILRERGSSFSAKMAGYKGIYNYSAEGEVSWFGFAQAILDADPNHDSQHVTRVIPLRTEEYHKPAKRPRYSVLSKGKIRRVFGISIASWRDQLAGCMQSLE